MKKITVIGLVLVLVLSLAMPVLAKENTFVPSITYKDEIEIVPVGPQDPDRPGTDIGDDVIIGAVREEEKKEEEPSYEDEPTFWETIQSWFGNLFGGNASQPSDPTDGTTGTTEPTEVEIISNIYGGCLVVTPVSKADTADNIPNEAAETLKYVYQALSEGEMKLPYDKVEGCDPENMVILELLDASWLCGGEEFDHDHEEEVAPEGVVYDITLKVNVQPKDKVVVMTYRDGHWDPIPKVVNNGNGTITCTFEHFCPIAIAVERGPVGEESGFCWLWILLLLLALAVLVVVIVYYRRKAKKVKEGRA